MARINDKGNKSHLVHFMVYFSLKSIKRMKKYNPNKRLVLNDGFETVVFLMFCQIIFNIFYLMDVGDFDLSKGDDL